MFVSPYFITKPMCLENELYSKTFEDEFSHKLNVYNFDEEEDNFYASPYYNDLDDLSI